jgi:hypothetical protein
MENSLSYNEVRESRTRSAIHSLRSKIDLIVFSLADLQVG